MKGESEPSNEKNKKTEEFIQLPEKNSQTELDGKEKHLDSINTENFELKDHYSIDDISYSKLDKCDEEDNSIISNKRRKINDLSAAILEDNIESIKNILNNNESLLMKKTLDGFTFIQYAVLNGSINSFKYLLNLKLKTNEDVEGFHLIHLSLMKYLFNKYKKKCIDMFNYIYQNLPEQKKLVDRLGRTYLHLILEYNIDEALINKNIELEELFIEDNNGIFALNYMYIFNAENCFWKIIKNPVMLKNLYITAREKYKKNKSINSSGEHKFLENLFIYGNYNIIGIMVLNCEAFFNEILEDLNTIYLNYSSLRKDDSINFENNDIIFMLRNIEYLKTFLNQNSNISLDFSKKNVSKTAIVYNRDCINHIKLPDNNPIKHYKKRNKLFENSDRLSCLINEENGIMLNDQIFKNDFERDNNYIIMSKYLFIESHRKSCLNDILKCHDIKYIKALKYKSDNIKTNLNKNNGNFSSQKFWDNVDFDLIEKNYFLYNSNKEDLDNPIDLYNYEKIDIDTFINQYSYENIFNTTGCVFDAIDIVMKEHATNSFALIRPPGHHSGYYGPVENKVETSNGFCLVNNVAIGAAYAKYKYHNDLKKIAIVDIDVHHGNGTEEIIEMLNYKNFTKPFKSEKICEVKLKEQQKINWLDFDDAKNVLFISTHIYDKNNPDKFYPYSGSNEKNTKKDSDIYPGGIYNIPFEFKENYPYEYKNILRSKIIPRLYKFKPDIIFVSAGFDGHKLESINQNRMLLQENDYGYIAQQLQLVANKFCHGRMISVLEGGYNVNTGIISPFAQSVFYFTRFMNIGANKLQCYDVKLTGNKRKMQLNEEIEVYNLMYQTKIKPRRSDRLKHIEEINNKNALKEDVNNNNEIKNNENNVNNKDENKDDNKVDNKGENNKNDNKDINKADNKDDDKVNNKDDDKINNKDDNKDDNKDGNKSDNKDINNDINKDNNKDNNNDIRKDKNDIIKDNKNTESNKINN